MNIHEAENIYNNLISDACWCLWYIDSEDIIHASKDKVNKDSEFYLWCIAEKIKWCIERKDKRNLSSIVLEVEKELSKDYYIWV